MTDRAELDADPAAAGDKAPYPCFATRYVDIKWGGKDNAGASDAKYLEWDEQNGKQLPLLSDAEPDTHAKYALLQERVLPRGAESLLWVPPVLWDEELLPGMDRGNPFAENREYTKTLVFGDYRMTTAAPVWYLRRAVEERQRAQIERPARPRTLSPDQLAVLQAYFQSCFARLPAEAERFVNRLLGGSQPLIEAVTGLQGEPARWYYAAQGRLKNVLEEYAFMLRGRQIGEVFDTLAGCRGVRIKMFGKDPENAAQLRGEGEGAIRLPPCGWAERFTEDDTDTNAHNKSHGQALQQRFNSPFWPVVLAASSVAQEGLDFHWYSHAIAHWSLPKNPVELCSGRAASTATSPIWCASGCICFSRMRPASPRWKTPACIRGRNRWNTTG